MSFFGSDYFAKPFFKKEFFGEPFFQGGFFDDTTIAHGYSGGTVDASTIKLVCTRTITGTVQFEQIGLTVNGVIATITDVVVNGTEVDVSIAPSTIAAGNVIKMSISAQPENNLGELTNAPIANNVV